MPCFTPHLLLQSAPRLGPVLHTVYVLALNPSCCRRLASPGIPRVEGSTGAATALAINYFTVDHAPRLVEGEGYPFLLPQRHLCGPYLLAVSSSSHTGQQRRGSCRGTRSAVQSFQPPEWRRLRQPWGAVTTILLRCCLVVDNAARCNRCMLPV